MPDEIMTSVAQRLKEHTLLQHREAEFLLMQLLNSIRTTEDYCSLLRMFYGYYAPVEQKIHTWISAGDLPDMEERNHSRRIFRDLISSGHNPETLQVSKMVPGIHSREEALGVMYVLEGATLGGQVIAKMLRKLSPGNISEHNLNFFLSYGRETGNKWISFVNLINQQSHSEPVLSAAVQTFSFFTNWIKQFKLHEYTHQD